MSWNDLSRGQYQKPEGDRTRVSVDKRGGFSVSLSRAALEHMKVERGSKVTLLVGAGEHLGLAQVMPVAEDHPGWLLHPISGQKKAGAGLRFVISHGKSTGHALPGKPAQLKATPVEELAIPPSAIQFRLPWPQPAAVPVPAKVDEAVPSTPERPEATQSAAASSPDDGRDTAVETETGSSRGDGSPGTSSQSTAADDADTGGSQRAAAPAAEAAVGPAADTDGAAIMALLTRKDVIGGFTESGICKETGLKPSVVARWLNGAVERGAVKMYGNFFRLPPARGDGAPIADFPRRAPTKAEREKAITQVIDRQKPPETEDGAEPAALIPYLILKWCREEINPVLKPLGRLVTKNAAGTVMLLDGAPIEPQALADLVNGILDFPDDPVRVPILESESREVRAVG